MKVLHLSNSYYGTKLYRNLLDALGSIVGVENTMVVCCPKGEVHNAEAGIIPLYIFNKTDRVFYLYKQNKMMRAIETFFRGQYDILHAHFLFTNGGIAYKLKKKYGTPYVVTVRNADVNLFFKYRKYLMGYANEILKHANAVTFLSDPYREKVIDNYVRKDLRDSIRAKSFVIPNGIDPVWLKNRSIRKREPEEKKLNIVYTGVIDRNKNLLTTLTACKKLIDEGYDINYTVIGSIKNREIYNKIVRECFVRYFTPKTHIELINIYKSQDIFVMPSIHESFGLVYAEAMSQGLPVIYSKGQGFDGHFPQGQIGFAVDSMDANAIVEAIKRILNDYNEMSVRCEKNSAGFDWRKIAYRYYASYHHGI